MRKEHEWIIKRINQNDRILDVGCGDGFLLDNLPNKEKFGVDMRRIRNPKFNFTQMNIDTEKLPFENNSFDVVISTEVLEHVHNPRFVVSEMKRVGKKVLVTTDKVIKWFLIGIVGI